ncbi:hypothetical protein IM774_12370 [Erysipelotrichaceae bacterium RD49]|nr:hypothetical protein [Erysipelotrichaceae bacterium RD49]
MKLKYIRNGIFASVLAAMTATNLNGFLLVHAEEFIGEEIFDYTEEAGNSLRVNYSQIKPFTAFNANSTITIPGSEYKNLISKNISNLSVYRGIPANTLVSLTGLDDLKGTIEYTFTSSLPISHSDNPNSLVNCSGYGVELENAVWYEENDKATGIKILVKVDWGKLLNSLPYLKEFQNTTFSPLVFDIDVNGLKLAEPEKLNNNTSFTLTGTMTNYTLKSQSQKVKIEYEKTEKNTQGFSVVNKYSGETEIKERINTGLPKSYTTIRIGEKNIRNNINNGSSPTGPSKPSADGSDADQVIVLRLYNPVTGEHLFTTNAAERVQLVSNGWKNEFCEWDTPANSDIPIYRLCNPNNHDHHYTTNAEEKDMLVQLGWRYEGSPFYSAEKGEGLPVYRLYNPNATSVGSHHYTSSQEERDALVNYGWNYEGIAWFGLLKDE